jgi:hypothetical protein
MTQISLNRTYARLVPLTASGPDLSFLAGLATGSCRPFAAVRASIADACHAAIEVGCGRALTSRYRSPKKQPFHPPDPQPIEPDAVGKPVLCDDLTLNFMVIYILYNIILYNI